MMDAVTMREPSGIAALLECNPVVGAPREGSRRFWTGREEKLLRQHYPDGGVSACLSVLPGRTAKSIYQRAGALGLRIPVKDGKVRERKQWGSSDQIDAIIIRTYQTKPEKSAVLRCAQLVGRPRWWVSKRALKLGLVVPRFREPEWSEAELSLIVHQAHKHPKTLQLVLKRAGYARTEAAIVVKLKRLGADRTDPDHLNANQLASLMGVDRKRVTAWITKGWLKAKRRQASALDDFWWIHRKDIRAFIIDNVAAVDLRKVEKFWFVDLLAGRASS